MEGRKEEKNIEGKRIGEKVRCNGLEGDEPMRRLSAG